MNCASRARRDAGRRVLRSGPGRVADPAAPPFASMQAVGRRRSPIPERHAARDRRPVVEPFFPPSRPVGTGPASRWSSALRQHKGTVTYQHGRQVTTFRSFCRSPASMTLSCRSRRQPAPRHRPNLIADDDIDIRETVSRILDSAVYSTLALPTATTAAPRCGRALRPRLPRRVMPWTDLPLSGGPFAARSARTCACFCRALCRSAESSASPRKVQRPFSAVRVRELMRGVRDAMGYAGRPGPPRTAEVSGPMNRASCIPTRLVFGACGIVALFPRILPRGHHHVFVTPHWPCRPQRRRRFWRWRSSTVHARLRDGASSTNGRPRETHSLHFFRLRALYESARSLLSVAPRPSVCSRPCGIFAKSPAASSLRPRPRLRGVRQIACTSMSFMLRCCERFSSTLAVCLAAVATVSVPRGGNRPRMRLRSLAARTRDRDGPLLDASSQRSRRDSPAVRRPRKRSSERTERGLKRCSAPASGVDVADQPASAGGALWSSPLASIIVQGLG